MSADTRLRAFRILPLSAAQLIDTDGKLTKWDGQGDVRERRRIEIRTRKSGDVIWHSKGEAAPVLTNLEKKTYRTLVIELK